MKSNAYLIKYDICLKAGGNHLHPNYKLVYAISYEEALKLLISEVESGGVWQVFNPWNLTII